MAMQSDAKRQQKVSEKENILASSLNIFSYVNINHSTTAQVNLCWHNFSSPSLIHSLTLYFVFAFCYWRHTLFRLLKFHKCLSWRGCWLNFANFFFFPQYFFHCTPFEMMYCFTHFTRKFLCGVDESFK